MKITTSALLSKISELAAARPGSYLPGLNTKHKRATALDYSYDDCIVGCTLRDLAPEFHEKLLAHERRYAQSFQLEDVRRLDDAEERMHHEVERARIALLHEMRELMEEPDAAEAALTRVQNAQDGRVHWDRLPELAQRAVEGEPRPWGEY